MSRGRPAAVILLLKWLEMGDNHAAGWAKPINECCNLVGSIFKKMIYLFNLFLLVYLLTT